MEPISLILVTTAIAAAAVTAATLYRQQRQHTLALWDRDVQRLGAELERQVARIAELERQVDSMHSRGIPAEPAPEPPDEPDELPAEILEHLDAIDDPEAAEEFEELSRFELARGKRARDVARELFEEAGLQGGEE